MPTCFRPTEAFVDAALSLIANAQPPSSIITADQDLASFLAAVGAETSGQQPVLAVDRQWAAREHDFASTV
ncbi:hypothetical protein D3C71_2029630 [compost metagenome]